MIIGQPNIKLGNAPQYAYNYFIMSDQRKSNPIRESNSEKKESYAIVLPCDQDQFGSFISGLLGKAQTIEKLFYGIFEITKHHIEDIFHLVDQRVKQQNEATLVQFIVKLLYDDNSSVLLNSLEDFVHYREVRPIVSAGALLEWTYLIRFADRKFPEKQIIEMRIGTSSEEPHLIHVEDEVHIVSGRSRFSGNHVFIRISHTARTWGVDIESLITGHLKSWFKSESRIKRFLYRKSSSIGLAAGAIFFLLILIGSYINTNQFLNGRIDTAKAILNEQGPTSINQKINFLIDLSIKGQWPRYGIALLMFIVVSVVGSVFLGTWVASLADNRPQSFVLLSAKAESARDDYLKKRARKWQKFILSVIIAIVTGIVGNIIFAYISNRWMK